MPEMQNFVRPVNAAHYWHFCHFRRILVRALVLPSSLSCLAFTDYFLSARTASALQRLHSYIDPHACLYSYAYTGIGVCVGSRLQRSSLSVLDNLE